MTTLQPRITNSALPAMTYTPALDRANSDFAPRTSTASEGAPARPASATQSRLFPRVTWWSDRRRLSLRQLRQELSESTASTPEGAMTRIRMLDRLDADLAIAEKAWHPNAGPDVEWPMGILKARYRGIENLLRPR